MIKNKVKVETFIDRKKLIKFQWDLKKQDNQVKILKLAERIKTKWFSAPIYIWKRWKETLILDWHQRLKALEELERQNHFLKDDKIPVIEIEADNEKEAKETLLEYNTKYSEFDLWELENWGADLDLSNLEIEELENLEMWDYGELWGLWAWEDDNNYTRKVEIPIYEPKGEKPKLEDVLDETKTKELIEKINNSNLDKTEKDFLIKASQRHSVFNYWKIADYYAHSDKETQELMEDSALVIVDFEKAIEKWFVQISEDSLNNYITDNENNK